ncbi:fatty acyl-CoA reductase 1-like [Salvia miltiorrhiza]|uniref:fatty acyl-CoA reductase 1-like n=1 Tax=Salvia miltiorrhiza TaxID=226208 RepID=UPI0025AD1852|nr:fatty acyl-CoA reductase 1-like [Salvia miltiorrhiza]
MEESKILQYFEGKTILITGATGFLAKIFLEKILRLQPNVKKLFLLMRASPKVSVQQRLEEEVVGTELFRVLREECGEDFDSIISSKVVPISGDVGYENLGIVDAQLRQQMWQEIDVIVNSAATTKFDERYDIAFGINALGAMHVQDFGTKCSKLEMLLHVSTAYVHGTKLGLMPEKAICMGETLPGAKIPYFDINAEKSVIQERLRLLQSQKLSEKEITRAMKDFGIERAMLHGWPNTYVFTKAIGEMLLEKFNQNCNVVIIRPTIITSTFKDPFPGWIEGLRTLDSIFVAYGKAKIKFFVGDPESVIDLVPGDMVVNCMIAAIANSISGKGSISVYQIGSSRRNPVKYDELKWLMHRYLINNPLIDSCGKPTKVGVPVILNTMASFHNYISFHYLPFVQMLRMANIVCCNLFESSYTNAKRRINHAMRLADLYKPYLFSQAIFDDSNTENLRMRMRGSNIDMELFNFDPKCIMWDDYLLNTHFLGIAKYVLNC